MHRFARVWALLSLALAGCAATEVVPAAADQPLQAVVWAPPVAERDLVAKHQAAEDAELASSPLRLEARVDRWLGEMAAAAGAVRHRLTIAELQRDAVQVECVGSVLARIEDLERDARRRRSTLRDVLLDDEGGAAAAASQVRALAADAASARSDADACVGEELAYAARDRDADGILDQLDRLPEDVRPRDVPETTGAPFRSEARLALLEDTVLASRAAAPGSGSTPAPPAQKKKNGAPPAPSPKAGDDRGAQAPAPGPAADVGRAAPHDESMIIRTAEIAIAVYEVEKKVEAVATAASAAGGYTSERTDRQITIRVPRERFADVLATVDKLGDVLHRNVSAEDVTDQFVDLEMRLRNALVVRARLEKLLEGATVKDAVEIHRELAKVTDEIERLQGKLKLLRDRIGYSTITVSFQDQRPASVRTSALLPFPWMNTIGLGPLLSVPR